MKVKIRILNEVHAVVLGLTEEHTNYFYDKYAVHAKNYFFNPKFKLGRWDGKIRFFQATGKTYLYLLEDMVPRIVNLGYKIDLEDLRTSNVVIPTPVTADIFADCMHPETGEPIYLRQYQVDAINSLFEHMNGTVIASTGSGKTLTCAAICKKYGEFGIRTLTIVPDQNLIMQTKADYINCKLDTGEYSGKEKTLDHQHVVSTWQALKNNVGIISSFQLILVDECHGLRGDVLSKIVTTNASNITYRFGVTGTLPKEPADCLAVHVATGPVRYTVPASELIEQGHLANPHIDMIELEEDLTAQYEQFCSEITIGEIPTYKEFKEGYFPDFSSEKSYLQRNVDRAEWIAMFIEAKRDGKKGNVLCLVDSIPFGRKLASLIPNSYFVNGKDVKSPVERKKIYDMFKDADDMVAIATVNIAGTGLNIPRIFNLMFVDIGKSFIRVIQAIGRGLRKAHDKDSVSITDIHSDLKYARKHSRERVKFYKEAKYPFTKHKINYMNQLD